MTILLYVVSGIFVLYGLSLIARSLLGGMWIGLAMRGGIYIGSAVWAFQDKSWLSLLIALVIGWVLDLLGANRWCIYTDDD